MIESFMSSMSSFFKRSGSSSSSSSQGKNRIYYFLLHLGITSIKVCTVFYLLLFCYLGTSSSSTAYTGNLVIACVDFDQSSVGNAFQKFIESIPAQGGLPTFQMVSSSNPTNITQAVGDWKYWGALYVNPSTTANLTAAVTNAATAQDIRTYNASKAITFVYDEGRFPLIVQWYILGPVRTLMPMFLQNFSSNFAWTLANSHPLALLPATQHDPALMISPISYSENNLHPATIQVAVFGLSVGMILLIIFSWVAWSVGYKTLSYSSSTWVAPNLGQKIARELTLLLGRLSISIWICFITSLSFTLIWQGLGAVFPSPSAWILFWMLHWLHMSQYLFFFASATNLAGFDSAPTSLVLAIIFNATAGLNELSLASPFYQWGVAMPMYHAVVASRTLLYGTKNMMFLNVGVLGIWFVAGLLVCILTAVPCKNSPAPTLNGRIPHYAAHGHCGEQVDPEAVVAHSYPEAVRVAVNT